MRTGIIFGSCTAIIADSDKNLARSNESLGIP
jgi:hypothetical protein